MVSGPAYQFYYDEYSGTPNSRPTLFLIIVSLKNQAGYNLLDKRSETETRSIPKPMKSLFPALGLWALLASCTTANPRFSSNSSSAADEYSASEEPITQSLFNDKSASISEEGIQKILAGTYSLPPKLRVAIVQLDNQSRQRYYWSEEQHLKAQQAYLDSFASKFKQSARVVSVAVIPDLLVSKTPTFTNIREAAVRMQADVVVAYHISSDVYTKYRAFSSPNIKAFATTQLLVLDVRTGLIPFSAISTKDALSQKTKEEVGNGEAISRIKNEAVLLTIADIGERISAFLTK